MWSEFKKSEYEFTLGMSKLVKEGQMVKNQNVAYLFEKSKFDFA